MSSHSKKSSIYGWLAGSLLAIFGKSGPAPTTDELEKAEFKTSTQRLGIRFTEHIRRIFRLKWLRKW